VFLAFFYYKAETSSERNHIASKQRSVSIQKKTEFCKLKGYDNTYRIRISTIRIVCDVLWKQKTILIYYVALEKKHIVNSMFEKPILGLLAKTQRIKHDFHAQIM
jgi:mRNA-degrading endonuclease RelE of RelBE toxin-antitoxin system